MKIKYLVIGKHHRQTREYVPYEDKKYENCLKEYKKLKDEYGDHIKFKIIKVTEEVIKK